MPTARDRPPRVATRSRARRPGRLVHLRWDSTEELLLLPWPPTGLADGFGREGRPTAQSRGFTPMERVGSPAHISTRRCRLARPWWARTSSRREFTVRGPGSQVQVKARFLSD